jgi:hypothetical protein
VWPDIDQRGGASSADAVMALCHLMQDRIAATGLNLAGLTVLTEAGTGPYATAPVIAALAGADHVWAFTRPGICGSAAEPGAETMALARAAGVHDRVTITGSLPAEIVSSVDIVTNSDSLQPIDAGLIALLPARAVVGLMIEGWAFQAGDIDLEACRRRGIQIAAVNERHPSVGVFSFLGPLCARLLRDAGLPVVGQRIAVLCDNPFAPFLSGGLSAAGAHVEIFDVVTMLPPGPWDAVVVALRPDDNRLRLAGDDLLRVAQAAPGTLLAQFWGDIDRDEARRQGLALWPPDAPRHGHMAILFDALGPEPVVRLQTGGLRAAELIRRGLPSEPGGIAERL